MECKVSFFNKHFSTTEHLNFFGSGGRVMAYINQTSPWCRFFLMLFMGLKPAVFASAFTLVWEKKDLSLSHFDAHQILF